MVIPHARMQVLKHLLIPDHLQTSMLQYCQIPDLSHLRMRVHLLMIFLLPSSIFLNSCHIYAIIHFSHTLPALHTLSEHKQEYHLEDKTVLEVCPKSVEAAIHHKQPLFLSKHSI